MTYHESIQSCPQSQIDVFISHVMHIQHRLVCQEDGILPQDHNGRDSEEYNSHETKSTTTGADRCHTHSLLLV